MTRRPTCLAVLGPTCSWKSETALLVAEALGGEILSCDSMQIYQGLDIGTAKPTADMLARCPHHFVDVLALDQPWDAHRFVEAARPLLDEVRGRGALPILAGGTGLYARALLYGFEMLPADRALFQRIEEELAAPGGKERLSNELRSAASDESDIPQDTLLNPRRLTRAVEVLRLTGKPPWELTKERPQEPVIPVRQFILMPTMAVLRPRIERRTAWMLDNGWIEEGEEALKAGLLETPTAKQALGYREIAAYLAGELTSRQELLEALINRTVRYARRQRTWFRHQHPGAEILEIDTPTTGSELCARILDSLA